MTSSFDDRADAFEKKFEHDQELAFKLKAKRNKLFGLWVAEKLGLEEEEAKIYAADIVRVNLSQPGDNDILDKTFDDLNQRGDTTSRHALEVKLVDIFTQVKKEHMNS